VKVPPWQIVPLPGNCKLAQSIISFTVIVVVVEQPLEFVYVIVALPLCKPVTKPVEETEATEELFDVHGVVAEGVPVPVNCVVEFIHKVVLPPIVGFTLPIIVADAVEVQPFGAVTVTVYVPAALIVTVELAPRLLDQA
jgi:hypothetical protein